MIIIFVFPTPHSGPGIWKVLNKYYLINLINKYKAFNEAKEAGFFSLQLQQIVHCKILLAIMSVEPSLQVNSVQYSPVLQQRLLLCEEVFPEAPCPRQKENSSSSMLP